MASVTIPGVAALKSVLDGLKGAGNVLRKADKIPEYQAVLDAYAQISEMQALVYDLNAKLREVTQELERVLGDQASAQGREFWQSLLWIPNDDHPYCVHCWDARKRLFHVGKYGRYMRCGECKNETSPPIHMSYWQWKERGADPKYW
jgi:hypothetical protein